MITTTPYPHHGDELVFTLLEFLSTGRKLLPDALPVNFFQFFPCFRRHYINRCRADDTRIMFFRRGLRRRARTLQNLLKSCCWWFQAKSKHGKLPVHQFTGQRSRQPRLRVLAFICQNDQSTSCGSVSPVSYTHLRAHETDSY